MKLLKKITLIILILTIALYILDYSTFFSRNLVYSEFKKNKKIDFKKNIYKQFCEEKYWTKLISFQDFYNEHNYRDALISDNTSKTPILLFGCSYMHGDYISYEDSFSYKLSKQTHRNVYNRAISGAGPKYMLYQSQIYYILKNYYKEKEKNKTLDIISFIDTINFDEKTKENFKKIFISQKHSEKIYEKFNKLANDKNIEYAFYIFMFDHIRRMHTELFLPISKYLEVMYERKNNNLILKDTLYSRYRILSLPSFYEEHKIYKDYNINQKQNLELFELYIRKTKELLEKNSPNIKFIIINYKLHDNYYYDNINKIFNDDKNIIVVDIQDYLEDDLSNKKYIAPDNNHPSGVVWDEVIPKLVKEFNL